MSENPQITVDRSKSLKKPQLLRFYSLASESYHQPSPSTTLIGLRPQQALIDSARTNIGNSTQLPAETVSHDLLQVPDQQQQQKRDSLGEGDKNLLEAQRQQHPSVSLSSLDLFRPPRQEIDRETESQEKERSATWLELFYDIFFVAIIRILSHAAHGNVSSMFLVVVRFIAIWWSWLTITLYDTRYDTDDLFHRTGKLVQMFSIAGFAISIEYCFQDVLLMNIFTLSYIIIRLTLLINYTLVYFLAFRDHHRDFYDPSDIHSHGVTSPSSAQRPRKHAIYNILANVLSIFFFGMSIMTETPWSRASIWLCSFAVDFAIQLWITRGSKHAPFRGSHLPERMGLFTIIVLGECVIAVLETSSLWVVRFNPKIMLEQKTLVYTPLPLLETLLLSASFIVICYCFWWMYFDDFCNCVMQYTRNARRSFLYDRVRNVWIYMHLPVHVAMTIMGIYMVDTINVVDSYRLIANTSNSNQTTIATNSSKSLSTSLDTSNGVTETNGELAHNILITFGVIFVMEAAIKALNTYKNEAAYFDHIAVIARIVFAFVLFTLLAIPTELYDPNPDQWVAPLVWLSISLAILCIVEVGFDLLVQYLNARTLRLTLTRSLNSPPPLSGSKDSSSRIFGDMGRLKPAISEPMEAIPMRELKST